jgi:hypothetical protein
VLRCAKQNRELLAKRVHLSKVEVLGQSWTSLFLRRHCRTRIVSEKVISLILFAVLTVMVPIKTVGSKLQNCVGKWNSKTELNALGYPDEVRIN